MFWYQMLSQGPEVNKREVLHSFLKSLRAMKDIADIYFLKLLLFLYIFFFFGGGGVGCQEITH